MASHPLFAVMVVLALGMGLFSLHQRAPGMTKWILAAAVAGLAARALTLASRRREERDGPLAVDHAALRRKNVLEFRGWLRENVRGQDEAVERVVRALQRGLELSSPGRSLGNFLLVGPTGTGKTFLSQLTAKALTPDVEPILLRMNQLKTPEDVHVLFGAPSMAGYEKGGALTGPVFEEPHRVVILDEADKCHPDVRHALLDALDAGRCRDKSTGRLVDFSGCVFFATCNAGVESLRQLPGGDAAKARDALAREANFDKAFLARFTEIVLMDALAPRHVAEIACLQLSKQWRGQGIELSYVSPELLARAVESNLEYGEYGVRQLAHCLRSLTDGTLEEARRLGLRRARLGYSAERRAAVVEAAR